ncbi:MAG: hypothetical protein KDK39_03445 [Leptospiraceae bacterium]|nr:hypothetical protein [Leptospiraceae bacterium]
MNPNLTSSEAHILFGKLYRKQRSPELQQKVDEIVSSTNDVFVRIKRIEDLDAGEAQRSRGVEVREGDDRPLRRGGGPAGRGGAGKAAKNTALRKKVARKSKAAGEGFFTRLFGTEVSRWGAQTGTIEAGFLARNPVLSPNIKSAFGYLTDQQIKATLAVFRGMLGAAWETLEPARYNTLIAAYQFLIEFVKAESAFLKQSDPGDLSASTLRMQKSWAQLQSFPNYQQILAVDFVKLVQNSEKFRGEARVLQQSMNYIVELDQRPPRLSHIIQSLYVLQKDKLVEWEEIKRSLAVKAPQLKQYRAPEAVMQIINKKIRGLKERIEFNIQESKEAERIRRDFLSMDESGKLDVRFLDPIIDDVLQRLFSEQKKFSPQVRQSYKTEPVKLLYSIMKDLELNLVFLLASSVMTKAEGQHSEEVLLFKQGLFGRHINLFRENWRNLELFVKKNRDINYTFSNYLRDQKEPSAVPEHKQFLQICRECMGVLAKLALDLKTVVANHELATQTDAIGKGSEKLHATRAMPIDSLEARAHYVPYADRIVFASTRMNGHKVLDLLKDYVRYLYNYLYIYRYPELISAMSSIGQREQENEKLRQKLEFMGVSGTEIS